MNDLARRMKQKLVDPALKELKTSTLAHVTEVNWQNKTCNVLIVEKDGNRIRKNNLSFDTGRGIESMYLQVGDTVEIGYRNNNFKHCYIIRIHEQSVTPSNASYGQDLPNYTNLF